MDSRGKTRNKTNSNKRLQRAMPLSRGAIGRPQIFGDAGKLRFEYPE